jgi:competence protein ComEC
VPDTPATTASLAASIKLEPLPVPRAPSAFQPIRRLRRISFRDVAPSPAALVPLFSTALLYLCGISLAHLVYLRPGPVLLSLFAFAAVVLWSVMHAPRIVWLPMALLWIGLGIWSAAMEPQPVPSAPLVQFASDGLLRTIIGTISAAEPLHNELADRNTDYDTTTDPTETPSTHDSLRQEIDLDVSAVEVIRDEMDRMESLPHGPATHVRVQLLWPHGVEARELECGDQIQAVVRLERPEIFRDPGVWDRAAYLETQQISATATLHAVALDGGVPRLQWIGTAQRTPACLLSSLRKTINSRLQNLPVATSRLPYWVRVTPADAAMLTALLTGDRIWLTRSLRIGFERTGSFHLVVVSGLHLAIVAGCVFAFARRLRWNRHFATAFTIASAFGYALFTGFGLPVQRSFWMVTLYLLGRLLYRHRSPLNVIGFAVLCLAVVSPRSIFDASFQMTALAVTAIAGIAIPLLEPGLQARLRALRDLKLISLDVKLPARIAGFRVGMRFLAEEMESVWGSWVAWRAMPWITRLNLRLTELICVTAIVELALALPMAMYFHRVTIYALPVNLCLLPLLAILLPVAMILLLLLCLWPIAAIIPAVACVALLHAGVWLTRWMGALTLGDLRIPEPGLLRTVAALAIFVLAVWLMRFAFFFKRRGLQWAALASLALMALLAVVPRVVQHPDAALLFEAMDVGQGDSLLLITPDGHTLLVDGGGLGLGFLQQQHTQGQTAFDTGEDLVSPVLWARGIRRLDVVALTHAHYDHMGGLPAILRNFKPAELWVGENPPLDAYRELLHEADSLGVHVRRLIAGNDFAFGVARISVFGPAPGYKAGPQPSNNDSLVLHVSYGAQSVLLTGDAESREEQGMLSGNALASTVLKVGHHGSMTSTSGSFLAAVHPQWAVISCGRKNRFGHPRQEILEELQAAHVKTYRTDSNGAMCFALDGRSVTVVSDCER